MNQAQSRALVVLVLSFLLLSGWAQIALAMGKGMDVPQMTKEELKGMLGNPDVIILDVRLSAEWKVAKDKIQGAVREDPEKIQSWADKYPKDKTLVLY